MSLQGKTAIVTGSTSGIGQGIARALAEQGANVMLNGTSDPAKVEPFRKELADKYGVKVGYAQADVSDAAQVQAMVQRAATELGGVDILVNNAGIQHVAPIVEFPLDKWAQVLGTNLSSVFYGMQAALPHMLSKGWGRIVNIASAHGLVASVEKVAYVAAKHGVVGATKVAALETAGKGVTVNAICPGWVLTPLVQKQIDAIAKRENISNEEATKRLLREKQPSQQFVSIEEVAALTIYLCSDAAKQITGSAQSIDGGWTAQ